MKQYVILKITRNCGHTEDASFDIKSDLEKVYNQQTAMPCAACIRGEKIRTSLATHKPNVVLNTKVKELQQADNTEDPIPETTNEDNEFITVNGVKCDRSFVRWNNYKLMPKSKRYKYMSGLLGHYGSVRVVTQLFDVSCVTMRKELLTLKIPPLTNTKGREQLNMTPFQGDVLNKDINSKIVKFVESPTIVSDDKLIPSTVEEYKRLPASLRRNMLFTLYTKHGSVGNIAAALGTPLSFIRTEVINNNIYLDHVRHHWIQTFDVEKIPATKFEFYKVPNEYKRLMLIKLLAKYKYKKILGKLFNIHPANISKYYKKYNVTDDDVKEYLLQQASKEKGV